PTYAFQHHDYWLNSQPTHHDTAAEAGLTSTDHPLAGVATELGDGSSVVYSGRLAPSAQPWLADHRIRAAVVVPAAALVEMLDFVADQLGLPVIADLTVDEPIVLPGNAGVAVQIILTPFSADGRRPFEIYARQDDGQPWQRHATGALARVTGHSEELVGEELGWGVVWPPSGAVEESVDGFYEGLFAAGFEYGPGFQGLRSVWRRGGEVFAEVVLPEGLEVEGFGVHPALFDAVLHGSRLLVSGGSGGGVLLPFAFSGVSVFRRGASVLRVRLVGVGDGVSVSAVDELGG
ncbi:polyketide synthase dehydratase domain-containing protein, partial [Micromonospora sp. DT31]|uniref:polyketide synthase dehydratase domain-containing protein n=1 Tax=Micromonospora sp. DT31 TaxID=3393434 RepID=UPI003CE72EC4